jgi:histidinol dehydrogenase
MKVKRFDWEGADLTARKVRRWTLEAWPDVGADVDEVQDALDEAENRDDALLKLTARFDATDVALLSLRVGDGEREEALSQLDARLRESMELAAANIRAVAEAQVDTTPRRVELPQGQTVTIREVPVGAAGIYAPGGRAAYPSTVLMCTIPARVAGVRRIALATPPGPDGKVNPVVLAAAALCEVDEVYAIGGAQAIFALASGTETIEAVDVVAGPGNAWVREAKARVSRVAGIDSMAGPSELMLIAGHDADPEWAALDLCAQAEHGADSPLLVAAVEEHVLEAIAEATERTARSRQSVADAPLALVQVPDAEAAIELANVFCPEHLELVEEDAALLADRARTAGCVFVGRHSATAFGDYAAGSNHVLPTTGAGRFSGPLGPGIFRRKIATVEIPAGAAAKLAPHVETIARAEGFPVHGESAMIRSEPDE